MAATEGGCAWSNCPASPRSIGCRNSPRSSAALSPTRTCATSPPDKSTHQRTHSYYTRSRAHQERHVCEGHLKLRVRLNHGWSRNLLHETHRSGPPYAAATLPAASLRHRVTIKAASVARGHHDLRAGGSSPWSPNDVKCPSDRSGQRQLPDPDSSGGKSDNRPGCQGISHRWRLASSSFAGSTASGVETSRVRSARSRVTTTDAPRTDPPKSVSDVIMIRRSRAANSNTSMSSPSCRETARTCATSWPAACNSGQSRCETFCSTKDLTRIPGGAAS